MKKVISGLLVLFVCFFAVYAIDFAGSVKGGIKLGSQGIKLGNIGVYLNSSVTGFDGNSGSNFEFGIVARNSIRESAFCFNAETWVKPYDDAKFTFGLSSALKSSESFHFTDLFYYAEAQYKKEDKTAEFGLGYLDRLDNDPEKTAAVVQMKLYNTDFESDDVTGVIQAVAQINQYNEKLHFDEFAGEIAYIPNGENVPRFGGYKAKYRMSPSSYYGSQEDHLFNLSEGGSNPAWWNGLDKDVHSRISGDAGQWDKFALAYRYSVDNQEVDNGLFAIVDFHNHKVKDEENKDKNYITGKLELGLHRADLELGYRFDTDNPSKKVDFFDADADFRLSWIDEPSFAVRYVGGTMKYNRADSNLLFAAGYNNFDNYDPSENGLFAEFHDYYHIEANNLDAGARVSLSKIDGKFKPDFNAFINTQVNY